MSDAPHEPQPSEELPTDQSAQSAERRGRQGAEERERVNHRTPGDDVLLGEVIRRALQEQAAHIHFSPELRARILSGLPPRAPERRDQRTRRRSRLVLALAATLTLLLCLVLVLLLFLPQTPPAPPLANGVRYQVVQTLAAPPALAQGGRLVAVDPTGHHLVIQDGRDPGVMYTASLSDPVGSQLLAMREAHDAAWSPDGTALVTVVTPPGAEQPLLALVPYGQYMYPLGEAALAATWTPGAGSTTITYVTGANGQTQLWQTTRGGHPTQLLATMNLRLAVQHLAWSPDGRYLALLVSNEGLNGPGRAIYLMNHASGQVTALVPIGDFTITSFGWSPDSQRLTYARRDAAGHTLLTTLAIPDGRPLLSLPLQGELDGWSWSPDGRALVYSDDGRLYVHIFSGSPIVLPQPEAGARQLFPFWLRDGRLLLVHIAASGQRTLQLLAPVPTAPSSPGA
ncbi:hypothetical protein KTAU_27590 [Thermogemmatispora aurantia]|uniref:PD40 domain-containing protein n=1 Tax=Thermogemmatispora aurantia TaxID=2045279 RepID=UPI0012892D54|nr:PD40 domain-containing protein [Thermogemmatispora aurantia]GER84123.1 hypothetical protein KTAU_27590 [Thermogemmatispora aurantia]